MKNLEGLAKYRKYQVFWWPVLIFLLIFFSTFMFLKPRVSQILARQKTYSQERKKLASVTQKAAFLEGLDQTELAVKTKQALEVLPAEADIAQVLMILKTIGQENALIFFKFDIDPSGLSTASGQQNKGKEGLPFLSLSFSVSGEKENIRLFLEKIENTLPVMRVENVAFTPQAQTLGEAELGLKVFFSLLPEKLGKLEEPLSTLTAQEEAIYQQIQELKPALSATSLPGDMPFGKENPFAF